MKIKGVVIGGILLLLIPVLVSATQLSISSQTSTSGTTAAVTVQSSAAAPNSIIDLELYDQNGNKVDQMFTAANLPQGSLACNWNMQAPSGAYTLKVGVFSGDWSTLYNWNNDAASVAGPLTGDNSISCVNASTTPQASFTSSASAQGTGSTATFTTTAEATQNVSDVLIDTELYDASNNKVAQWYETDNLLANTPFITTHQSPLPAAAGTYTMKVGLFSPDWSTLYSWNNDAGSVTVTSGATNNNPPPSPPSNALSGIINPSSESINPGSSIDFTGSNFGHEETVSIARNGASIGSAHADGGGNFSTGSMSLPNANGVYVYTFTGQTSGTVGTSTIQIGSGSQPQQPMSTGSLIISLASTPVPQDVSIGASNVLFDTILLDASASSEDVRISSLPLSFAGNAADISGCQLWNVTTALNTGSHVINAISTSAANNFSFDNSLTIPKGTVSTLSLECNVSQNATYGDTYRFGLNSNYSALASGAQSGNTFAPAIATNAGPIMTASKPVLIATLDASTPPYSLVSGGTTGATLSVLKFTGYNEAINILKIGLQLSNSASSSPADLTQTYLYAGNNLYTTSGTSIAVGTLLGTATFAGTSDIATSTLNLPVQLAANTSGTIIIKADVANVGTNQPGTSGHLVAVDFMGAQAAGASSGTVLAIGASNYAGGFSAGIRIFRSVPIIAAGPAAPADPSGANQVIKKFSITASSPDTRASLGIYQMNFALATTSANATNLQLHAYTDSGYSQPANVPGNNNGQFGSTLNAPASSVSFDQSSPIELSQGQTIYFALTGNITAASANDAVSAALLGDNAYPSLSSFMGTAPQIAGMSNFVWSPNTTTTSATTNADWTNGYDVWGLPASGL